MLLYLLGKSQSYKKNLLVTSITHVAEYRVVSDATTLSLLEKTTRNGLLTFNQTWEGTKFIEHLGFI